MEPGSCNVADLVDPAPRRPARRNDGPDTRIRYVCSLDAPRSKGPWRQSSRSRLSTGMRPRRASRAAMARCRSQPRHHPRRRHTPALRVRPSAPVIAETKTSRSRRQVELSDFASDALRRHRASQTEVRLPPRRGMAGPRSRLPQPVRETTGRRPPPARAIRAVVEAGRSPPHPLSRSAPHRRDVATGPWHPPEVVSEMLGHTTVGITLDLYSHVTPTMQREAARAMDDLLGP